jgi:hypothetical protein
MNCQQVQINLSLYLYGELDFAQEDALEEHLDGCAFCQRALAREKDWHSTLNTERLDVPLDLLSDCRRDLSHAIRASGIATERSSFWSSFSGWLHGLGFARTRWSAQLAAASFLLFVGFGVGRLLNVPSSSSLPRSLSSLFVSPSLHVRDIQPDGKDGVRLIIDREDEITGRVDDGQIRRLLLSAMQDPTDPGIRVYSVEVLKGQHTGDIRDALLNSARNDSNAAVRLKALEALRQFPQDSSTLETLKFVLEHDADAGVRSEAIDMLASTRQVREPAPDLASTLRQVLQSEREDDYVRTRCIEMLREMNAPANIY